jgi:hypothetical protein
MSQYGAATPKATWLYSNSSRHLGHVARARTHPLRPRVPKRSLVRKAVKAGRVTVTGTVALSASQSYPAGFGQAVAATHLALQAEWLEVALELRRSALQEWRRSGSTLAAVLRGSARWCDADLRPVMALLRRPS